MFAASRRHIGFLLAEYPITKAIVVFTSICIVFTTVFFSVRLMSESSYGVSDPYILNFDHAGKEFFSAATIALCTAAGIFSKHVYDFLSQGSQPATVHSTFRALLRSVALAIILSPIVVGAFMNELKQIGSPIFAIIFAYQNGFFFQTILQQKK